MRRPSVLGIVIVTIGVLFLLSEFHLVSFDPAMFSSAVVWSLILALVGLSGVLGSRKRLDLASLFIFLLGLLLALQNAHLVPLLERTSGWNLLWGLLIVYIGLEMLLPRRWRRHRKKNHAQIAGMGRAKDKVTGWDVRDWYGSPPRGTSGGDEDGKKRSRGHRVMEGVFTEAKKWIGDLSIGQYSWVLKDMSLWNGLGDIRLNLATAQMEPGTYHLSLGGWIGDVRLLVPQHVALHVSANVSLGDVTVFDERDSGMSSAVEYRDDDFDTADIKIHLDVNLKIGDVQIARV